MDKVALMLKNRVQIQKDVPRLCVSTGVPPKIAGCGGFEEIQWFKTHPQELQHMLVAWTKGPGDREYNQTV